MRPRAEYASCVWSPLTVSDSHQVEMVQHTAARWVLSWHDSTSSVTDMPSELKWRTLEQRRADTALTMLYKIRNGHLLTSPTHLTPVTGILASAHPHHYVQDQTDTLVQRYSFSRTPYDCGMRFLTLWPWLRRPTPSGIEWARCSTRPETKPPPALSPRAPPPPGAYCIWYRKRQRELSIQLITLLSD